MRQIQFGACLRRFRTLHRRLCSLHARAEDVGALACGRQRGLALLQTAVNPYVSILGPIESAAQRIALMGICNKIAGMLAPVLIGTVVLHGIGDLSATVAAADEATKAQLLNEFAAKIHAPYLAMAGLLLIPKVVSQSRYLTISAVLGVVFCLGAWATHGYVSVAFVALLGFVGTVALARYLSRGDVVE